MSLDIRSYDYSVRMADKILHLILLSLLSPNKTKETNGHGNRTTGQVGKKVTETLKSGKLMDRVTDL
jgi:hypothetical protein